MAGRLLFQGRGDRLRLQLLTVVRGELGGHIAAICRRLCLYLPLGPICILDRVRQCLIDALLSVFDTLATLLARILDGLLHAVTARP